MDDWLEAKRLLAGAVNAIGLVVILFAAFGAFDSYAAGWGKQIAIAFAAICVFGSTYVKKLPI